MYCEDGASSSPLVRYISIIGGSIGLARSLRRRQTKSERLLWQKLRNRKFHNLKFRRQVPIGRYVVDFFCAEKRLVIELDGSGHARSDQIKHDYIRDQYLEKCGLQVLRFANTRSPTSILRNIEEALSLSLQGEG